MAPSPSADPPALPLCSSGAGTCKASGGARRGQPGRLPAARCEAGRHQTASRSENRRIPRSRSSSHGRRSAAGAATRQPRRSRRQRRSSRAGSCERCGGGRRGRRGSSRLRARSSRSSSLCPWHRRRRRRHRSSCSIHGRRHRSSCSIHGRRRRECSCRCRCSSCRSKATCCPARRCLSGRHSPCRQRSRRWAGQSTGACCASRWGAGWVWLWSVAGWDPEALWPRLTSLAVSALPPAP